MMKEMGGECEVEGAGEMGGMQCNVRPRREMWSASRKVGKLTLSSESRTWMQINVYILSNPSAHKTAIFGPVPFL